MSKTLDDLWARFGNLQLDDVPKEVHTVALQCIADWFGCAAAGSREELVRILLDEFSGDAGSCSVIGTSQRLPMLQAALVNGAAGHALDFDDAHLRMGGHPTVPVLPAAWALAESMGASGAEFISAFITGFEIESRLGIAIGPDHYAKGWHQTATIGIFGAAAAASRLLGLDRAAFGQAIGIAASQASGLKANFGTMTKPFHAGHAAERGLLSARLAARGFTSNEDALEANQGFAQAAGAGRLITERLHRHADDWLILSTLFKYHASCYLTHASIEAVSHLARAHLQPSDIVHSVDLDVNPSILDVCGIADPKTGLECKFSLRATAALALLGRDTTDPATFDEDVASEPDVRAAMETVTVRIDPDLTTTQTRATVSTDGGTYTHLADTGVPLSDLDLQEAKIQRKFGRLVTSTYGADATERMRSALTSLSGASTVAGVMNLVR